MTHLQRARRRRRLQLLIIALVAAILLVMLLASQQRGSAEGRPLLVYCAAALKPPLEIAARDYEREFGVKVQAQYGASGALLSSIKIAKQGDLFLPADESFITLAQQDKLIGSSVPLAYMHPVILVQKGNPRKIASLADLLKRDRCKIAFANPGAASIGKITRSTLQQAKLWERFAPRITVTLPTVTDVANAVKLGTVDAGIVWDAVAKQYPGQVTVEDPLFRKARQRVVVGVLTTSKQQQEAQDFARYLGARDKGLQVLQKLGYATVKGEAWKKGK